MYTTEKQEYIPSITFSDNHYILFTNHLMNALFPLLRNETVDIYGS